MTNASVATPKTTESSVDQAMQTLSAQWYNAMVTGLGLSPEDFQIFQGPNTLMTTSQQMWNIFNAIPPKSINNLYNPSQLNNFSSKYGEVLTALKPASDSAFQNCMGDYYSKWQTYFSNNVPDEVNAETVTKVFKKWAVVNAPGQAGCVTGLSKIYIDPITIANSKYGSANEKYAWNRTSEQLKSDLAGGQSKHFTLDSKTEKTEVKHTWAGGGASFFWNIFSIGGGGSYDKLSTKATSSGLKIDAKYDKVTTFQAGPLAQNDPNNPILSDYTAWYESAALSKAYSTKDNTVWNNESSSNWENVFGTTGSLQRMTTALVVADGIEISITSEAQYSSAEQTEIKTAAKVGIWPFFSANGNGGTTNNVTFNDNGSFTITTSVPKGNPQVLGILQAPFSKIFR